MNNDWKDKPHFDMRYWSAKRSFETNLKQEGRDVQINFSPTKTIGGIETPIRAIVRRTGTEDKQYVEDRKIIIDKVYRLKTGDYITYPVDTYNEDGERTTEDIVCLVDVNVDKESLIFDTCKARICPLTINWKNLETPLWVWWTKSSYGEKGLTFPTDYEPIFDSRLSLELQYNKASARIYAGMRFMFNHSINAIYEVTFVNRLDPNLLSLTLRVSKYIKEDDLENNICYNPQLEKPEDPLHPTYSIEGEREICLNSTEAYYLDPIPESGTITWGLEDGTDLEIVNTYDNCVEVKGLTKKKFDLLKCYVDGELIATKTLYVVNII